MTKQDIDTLFKFFPITMTVGVAILSFVFGMISAIRYKCTKGGDR